jgi:hypothetical protein
MSLDRQEVFMNDIKQIMSELSVYSEADGTEWGETANKLMDLWRTSSLLDEEFIMALEKEIRSFLVAAQGLSHFEETVHTPEPYTVKELVWD